MPTIPGFWDIGPHEALPVEETWRNFVRSAGGRVVDDLLPQPRRFENADFVFLDEGIAIELKEIECEFSKSKAFLAGFSKLMDRLMTEDPAWKPVLFGGAGEFPAWFDKEYVRLFRPPLSRILKKANRQLRKTISHFGFSANTGVLLMVNDGFTSISPMHIWGLSCDLLVHSFSSIDCCVYLTVNRYVEVAGSGSPALIWVPSYSARAPDSLSEFVDDLGRKWFGYLEPKVGPYTTREPAPTNAMILIGSRSIVVPGEDRG